MQEILITPSTAGGRLDKAVMKYLDKAPSGFIYKMLRKKNIVLNDKRAEGKELLRAGDTVRLYLADETIQKFRSAPVPGQAGDAGYTGSASIQAPSQNLHDSDSIFRRMIVYEDEHILAINKPAGLLSQKASPSDVSVNDMLAEYLPADDLFTPGISQRLDRNTSGLMLAGKNPAAVRALNTAIRTRACRKLYLCPVHGCITKDAILEGYLHKNEAANRVRIVQNIPKGKTQDYAPVRTAYSVLDHNDRVSLLLVDLITGRSHQIRAHLASVGHPIVGDAKYGDSARDLTFRQKYHIRAQLLHACRVEFTHMEGILEYLNGRELSAPVPDLLDLFLKGEGLCLHGVQED